MWILVISLGLAIIAGIYVGITIAKSTVTSIMDNRNIDKPPNEYLDLVKGGDSSGLQFLKARVKLYRNPIVEYRYENAYQILETKLNVSDTGSLGETLEIVQADLSFNHRHDRYEGFPTGRIVVAFKDLDPADSTFKKVRLIIEGKGLENFPRNDSVVSYFMERGSFGFHRSPDEVPSIYSSNNDKRLSLNPPGPTALLFKRRGNSLFILVACPILEQTELPKDLLLRLVGDKP